MLGSRTPAVTELNVYLDSFTQHKRTTNTTIGNDTRFRLGKSASCPGPGYYRVDRDLPENPLREYGVHNVSGVHVPPKYSMPTDSRLSPDGVLKGLTQPKANRLGPGQYEVTALGVRSSQKQGVVHRFPMAKETAEALRDRKKTSNNPGPGKYALPRYGDNLGTEKLKAMDRAVRRGTGCWAAPQYSHIFTCMKPRGGHLAPAASAPVAVPHQAQQASSP
mmetsp:Transcript_46665/g.117393  ORF Transcript_46665/g.117393 Transcript_46665/m.117393 type:complete len:220 (+) Transcript_46665:28-687(+)